MESNERDPAKGLSGYEARERLARTGPNVLTEERPVTFLNIFWEEIREPMILLLLVVAIFYSVWGELGDTLTILTVITLLVLAEVFNEYRAKRAIAALKKLSAPLASVVRDGKVTQVPTAELVPGDALLLKVGARVAADARLLQAYGLEVDESALTGESVPVVKDAGAVLPEKTPLAERTDEVFAGTVVTRGKGIAEVTATGMGTELGRVTGLTRATKEPKTPLQKAMKELSIYLAYVAVFFSVAIPLIGFLEGRPFKTMVLTGLGLAFATIPEELPIIITMVLGLGAFLLYRRHALVKRLRAAETLGSVTVIATDKTGTLTENRMVLSTLYTDGKIFKFRKPLPKPASALLEMGALVNDVVVEQSGDDPVYAGDPTEIALVSAFYEANPDAGKTLGEYKLINEFTFDNQRKLMSAVYEARGASRVILKGAPEAALARSTRYVSGSRVIGLNDEKRKEIGGEVEEMAKAGERVLAFAYKDVPAGKSLTQGEAEQDLIFAGMAGFLDPPRKDVVEAVKVCRRAGIRVLMITGDLPLTAKAVAGSIGIDDGSILTGAELDAMNEKKLKESVKTVSVFARTTPEHKLKIVRALKDGGEIVAVTGDGINDAPALREADIGVAMGETGTDVAREAADMILMDDNFTTVTYAVREGRKLYDNLSKGVRYYLAVKVGLISIFILPILLGIPLPFAPIQIIVLELFMDLAASAAFVGEPEERDLMSRRPHDPRLKFMDRAMLTGISYGAASLFTAVTLVYLVLYYGTRNQPAAQTAAFATWMFGHIFLAFNMRSFDQPLVRQGLLSNKVMIVWALAAIGVLLLAANVPLLHQALKLTYLSGSQWLLVTGVAFVAAFWMEVKKLAFPGRNP